MEVINFSVMDGGGEMAGSEGDCVTYVVSRREAPCICHEDDPAGHLLSLSVIPVHCPIRVNERWLSLYFYSLG